jgi:hypothetical protein
MTDIAGGKRVIPSKEGKREGNGSPKLIGGKKTRARRTTSGNQVLPN